MEFIKEKNTSEIRAWRRELYQRFKAPLDDMWEGLYITLAQNYIISRDGEAWGYCCINKEKSLLQIYLKDAYMQEMENVIEALIAQKLIVSASLSAIEPAAFNTCLERSIETRANTYCYRYPHQEMNVETGLHLVKAQVEDHDAIKDFFFSDVEFDDTFGYIKLRTARGELYLLKDGDEIMATGECRISPSQEATADMGMAVRKDLRGRGIGSKMMQEMVRRALAAGCTPICSTTVDNIASQGVIKKAGLFCEYIIFNMKFV